MDFYELLAARQALNGRWIVLHSALWKTHGEIRSDNDLHIIVVFPYVDVDWRITSFYDQSVKEREREVLQVIANSI